MSFCFYICFVHIAKKGLIEYQQSGFPVNSSSKRRRLSSQDSPDDYLRGTKMFADNRACAGGTSTELAEVTVVSTHKWSCSFLHRQVEDCQDQGY